MNICNLYERRFIPDRLLKSSSLNEKWSTIFRVSSGEVGLWDGGVGRDEDGGLSDIRASSDAE